MNQIFISPCLRQNFSWKEKVQGYQEYLLPSLPSATAEHEKIRMNKTQVIQPACPSPGSFLDHSALFSQKNCPFTLKWVTLLCHLKFHTDLYFCWCGGRCFRQKWQLAVWPELMAFFPRFCRDTRKKKTLFPFQCPFVALPVMCDPVLFDFVCSLSSLLFALIYWNSRAGKLDLYLKWHWETTVIISLRAYFFKLSGDKKKKKNQRNFSA